MQDLGEMTLPFAKGPVGIFNSEAWQCWFLTTREGKMSDNSGRGVKMLEVSVENKNTTHRLLFLFSRTTYGIIPHTSKKRHKQTKKRHKNTRAHLVIDRLGLDGDWERSCSLIDWLQLRSQSGSSHFRVSSTPVLADKHRETNVQTYLSVTITAGAWGAKRC